MKWQDVGEQRCSVARTLSVIGDRWTMLVLRNAFMGVRRFDAFQHSLGVTRHVLSDRLKRLVEHDILQKCLIKTGKNALNIDSPAKAVICIR